MIAHRYGVTTAQLKTWNNISGNMIHAGRSLVINKKSKKAKISFCSGLQECNRKYKCIGYDIIGTIASPKNDCVGILCCTDGAKHQVTKKQADVISSSILIVKEIIKKKHIF